MNLKSAIRKIALSKSTIKSTSHFAMTLSGLSLIMASTSTLAQNVDNPESVASKRPTSRLIEEVVVTAQKREQNVQDVPISLQAYSQGALDARGVISAADLPHITPGLTVTSQTGYTSTYIRGVGSDAFVLGDPSVANYVDGVYYPLASGSIQNFGSVERIEVLKGPQGTLFGRNAVGGAINVITKQPSLNELELSTQLTYEAFDTPHDATAKRGRARVSVPVIENVLAVSLSGIDDDADHHIDGRVGTDARDGSSAAIPKTTEKGIRAKVLFAPTDWLEAGVNYSRIEVEGVGSNYAPNQQPSGLGVALPKQDARSSQLDPPRDAFNSVDTEVYAANLTIVADWFDIKLLGSDQRVDVAYVFDFDGTPVPLATFYVPNLFSDNQSAEIQFVSNDTSWGADWLEWTAGAYYFESSQGFNPAFFQLSVANLSSQLDLANTLLGTLGLPPVGVPEAVGNLLEQVGVVSAAGGAAGDINFKGLLDTESLAFYAQATVEVTDWFSLTLGGRYTDEERTLVESSSGIGDADGQILIPINNFSAATDPSFVTNTQSFDPKISFEFRPDWGLLGDSPLIYANYQTATKAAIINVVNILPGRPPQLVDEEEIAAFEVGLKSSLFDGYTTFNVAAFHYIIESPQQQFISFLAGGAVQFENSGEQQQTGIEFDVTTPIFASVFDSLILSVGALYLDAEYTDYRNASGFNAETGLFEGGNDYSGNQIVKSPEITGNIGLLQTINTQGGPLEFAVDYYYTSEYSFAPQGTDNVLQDGYGLIGARVSYLYEPWNLRATLFGKNLTGEDYNVGIFQTDFGTMSARAAQESYGLRLNWEY